jgi:beta-glucuronidase
MKRFLLLSFVLCVCAVTAHSQSNPPSAPPAELAAPLAPANLIADIPGRTTTSLDGEWHAIVDPFGRGDGSHYERDRKAKDKSELVEYNFDTSPTLQVPGDWNSQRPDLMFYEGLVWYKRAFTFHKKPGTRVFIYFGGANYHARVFLNTLKIGEHFGGFTAFNFEVTDTLADGDNTLIVAVDAVRGREEIPAPSFDWWNYGGLTRDVSVVEVPQTFVQDYSVQLAKGSMNEISGWVQLNGAAAAQQPVTIEIPEANIKQSVTTDANGHGEFQFAAKLNLWSPDNPKLYRVVVSTTSDSVADDIGFRSIETRGTQILLNGKPIFLRGVAMHEEAAFRDGRAVNEDDDRVLLGWAKELGCNFVRLAHYPYNEPFIRLADRMGIMVWSEVPLWQGIAWDSSATLETAEEMIRDNIARDHNRAAIVIWSVANETRRSDARLEFLRKLTVEARTLDSTRLISAAMNSWDQPGPNSWVLSDALGQYLDVLGLNQYIGWYNGTPDDCDTANWSFAYTKPVIATEFGGEALAGYHADSGTRWSEEYQTNLYNHQLAMLQKIPALAGMSPWILKDMRSPGRALPGFQDFHNRKGLISDRGQRKQAFYILQKFYAEKAAVSGN